MIQPVQEGGWEYSALKFVLDLVYISQSKLIFNIYCKSCLQESQIKQDNTTDQNLKFAKLKLQAAADGQHGHAEWTTDPASDFLFLKALLLWVRVK